MGVSGIILKKKEDVNIHKIICDVKKVAKQAGLDYRRRTALLESAYDDCVYTIINIADTFDDVPEAQQWVMYIYSNDDSVERFDWILSDGQLIRVIVIEDIEGCEKILLEFLHEYFRLNPEDLFWNEFDWYFTYNDIKRIMQKEFDVSWCYTAPNEVQ